MAENQRKANSRSTDSLQMIWYILRRYSSREHPLSIRQIHKHMEEIRKNSGENIPSLSTLKRMLPKEIETIEMLFPGHFVADDSAACLGAYPAQSGLHLVVETPDGHIIDQFDAGIALSAPPRKTPSYSTIDNLLRDFRRETFPFSLRCVAPVKGEGGKVEFIPYSAFEADMDPDRFEQNNVARHYYLENTLTDAEWRIFADLIQVYPFITVEQTSKFLTTINQMRSQKIMPRTDRYAYKHESEALFRIIDQLDEAIRRKKKVHIEYGEYILEKQDGTYRPRLVRRKRHGSLKVSPYALMWSNGNYYLVAMHHYMMNLRVDRILSVEIDEEADYTLPDDFDPVEYRNRSPVMYPGDVELVQLRCKESMLNVLIDFFGPLPQYLTPKNDGYIECSLRASCSGVPLFAMLYADSVEVLSPHKLRCEITDALQAALKKYASADRS